MPALETLAQYNMVEAPPADNGDELAVATSPRMEQVVTQLAVAYGVDLSQPDAKLSLDLSDKPQRWMIANIDGERIGVTRLQVDEENGLAPDLDIVFAVTSDGWEPREIIHTESLWGEFTRAAQEREMTVFDAQGNLRYDVFMEFWAQKLEQAEQLEQAKDVAAGKARLTSERDENDIKKARRELWEATGYIPPIAGGAPNTPIEPEKQFNWKRDLSANGQQLYYWLMLDMANREMLPVLASGDGWNLQEALNELGKLGLLDESDLRKLKLSERG